MRFLLETLTLKRVDGIDFLTSRFGTAFQENLIVNEKLFLKAPVRRTKESVLTEIKICEVSTLNTHLFATTI